MGQGEAGQRSEEQRQDSDLPGAHQAMRPVFVGDQRPGGDNVMMVAIGQMGGANLRLFA